MDADVYGPSIPTIMGATTPPTAENGTIVPVLRYGVKIVSMGFFAPKGEATIWRGPMLAKVIDKFLGGVEWGELDYLLVDLPPGTGDVQLSLCQKIPLTGAAVVSTPQDLAFNVAEKAIFMFTKLRTPVLGLVENMSGFECRHCGHREEIFGSGGARRFAMANEIPFLGEIPLSTDIRTTSDEGNPIVQSIPSRRAPAPSFGSPRTSRRRSAPSPWVESPPIDRRSRRLRGHPRPRCGFSGRTGTKASTPAMPCAWAVGARCASTRFREQAASRGIDQQGCPSALDRPGGPVCDPLPVERRTLDRHLHVRASARAMPLPDLRGQCRSTNTIEALGTEDTSSGLPRRRGRVLPYRDSASRRAGNQACRRERRVCRERSLFALSS